MPISSSAATVDKQKIFWALKRTRSIDLNDSETYKPSTNFLKIEPALPLKDTKSLYKRSNTIVNISSIKTIETNILFDAINLETDSNGIVTITRTQKQKEKDPDRISLHRRGLTQIPIIKGEIKLRLLSLQHNLINNVDNLKKQIFQHLVFLDLYDNQLEKLANLDSIENLRVLLLGKNRLKRLDGLASLKQIEVLDLHGNKISHINGLSTLNKLKVLNLAGNQIRLIGILDFHGLDSLQELNLRRNHLKKVLALADTPNLLKLFLSNNDIQNITDISSVAKSPNIKEICIENNPISINGDCVSFLISYLPQLVKINSMPINEQVRKAAMAWRRNKESSNPAFMDLTSDVCLRVKREEVISNAKTNWELLRSQTKCVNTKAGVVPKSLSNIRPDTDFFLTKLTNARNRPKTKCTTTKVPFLSDRNKLIRSASQDSQNTSSSNGSNADLFRLPPILVPIIDKMEKEDFEMKRSESSSSIAACESYFSSDTESIAPQSSNEEDFAFKSNNLEKSDDTLQYKDKSKNDLSSNFSGSLTNIEFLPSSEESNSSTVNKKRYIKSASNARNQSSKHKLRATTAKSMKKEKIITPQVIEKDREQGGDYLIELCGRYLNVYGQGALRFIDKNWNCTKIKDITTVRFNYVNFNNIIGSFGKLKNRFPNIESYIFKETNISFLGQLNALAEAQGMSSLTIDEDGNPICKKKWQSYAIFRLSHWGLQVINEIKITEEDIKSSNDEYQSLSYLVLWSLPEIFLEPLLTRMHIDVKRGSSEINAKQWLMTADPELRNVVSKEALQWKKTFSQEDSICRQKTKTHMLNILEELVNTVIKLRMLENQWLSILQEFVYETLLQYSNIEMHMKEKLEEMNL